MADTAHVTAGKPMVGGHVFRAPVGTPLPTDALSTLNEAFKDLGYIDEEGITNSNSPETTIIRSWGGTPVLVVQTSKDDTYKARFISSLNIEVLKMVYGDSNVTGTDMASGIKVTADAKELEDYSYVIEMIAKGNIVHRVVIPRAKPSEIGDVVYTDSDAVGYDVTLACTGDETGATHFDYYQTDPNGDVVGSAVVGQSEVG